MPIEQQELAHPNHHEQRNKLLLILHYLQNLVEGLYSTVGLRVVRTTFMVQNSEFLSESGDCLTYKVSSFITG